MFFDKRETKGFGEEGTISYNLWTDETEVPLSPNWKDIKTAIERLDGNNRSFLVLEAEPPLENAVYVQAAWYTEKTQGFFKKTREPAFYLVEVQILQSDGMRTQYALKTQNEEDIRKIFQDFFIQRRLPDLEVWENAGFY
ncbi:MAG: hypothetical protein LBD04_04530 [Synergistaceae bacterium]|jgi:hypothetical protein|nr:hypothetical protein [Synergistaceae bacterium]